MRQNIRLQRFIHLMLKKILEPNSRDPHFREEDGI
jgi:hypothetical protein